MKIYMSWEPVPSRMLALTRLLAAAGDLSRDDIEGLLQPMADAADSEKKPRQARETLEAAVECGLVDEDKTGSTRRYSLSKALTKEERDPVCTALVLPRVMARLLLNPSRGLPDSFATKCAWFIAQPVPPHHKDKPSLIKALGQEVKPKDIDNEERLDMLFYWMTYIGLGRKVGDIFLVDPTELIGSHLDLLLGEDKPTSINKFLAELADLFPVFDGGTYSARFRGERAKERLSQALSLAIARLADRNFIEHECQQDARDFRVLELGSEPLQIAKLHLGKKGRREP